jgi:uncharacterized protein GlcG (DUF336 family)
VPASANDKDRSMTLPLQTANRMLQAARRLAREQNLQPLTICVLDRSGHIVSAQREDGSTLLAFELAYAKAWGCLGLGHSTRYFKDVLVKQTPGVTSAIEIASQGRFIAEYGGVLVRDAEGELVGAVGIDGADETQDEAVAVAIIEECGLQADLH